MSLMSAGGAGWWRESLSPSYRYQRTRIGWTWGVVPAHSPRSFSILSTLHAVTGIDASAGFIEYAKMRIDNPLASFKVGDARLLPIDTASFDVAVSAWALNFVPEPAEAIAEMTRAIRPVGMVAAYVWDYAEKMELIRYFWDAAVALDPAAIDLD